MTSRHKFWPTIKQLLLVTLLSLPLLTPLWRWSAVPCTHDGHLHVHRVAAMRHAWEQGVFFTRWLPDLAFGYGYPFFVYREPAPLYAVLFPHLLGLPMAAASNLFYAVTILTAGWFMFLWVRDVAGPRAGLVSAVAYMAAPYLLVDALVRGNSPESLALPLFPFLLWMGRRWIIGGRVWPFLLSVLGVALLSLSHNISTLIFTPTLLVYLLAVGRSAHVPWRSLLLRLALLFGLGLALTFFYTGGAILEMDQVTLSQSTTTRNNDFHYNFASLAEMLAPVTAENPLLLNPPLPIRIGWVTAVLALVGALAPLWKRPLRRDLRLHIVLMLAAAAVFLFMALPLSLPLWENLPLIDFVQFPWRFIGRAALPLAFLAGMPFADSGTAVLLGSGSKQRRFWAQIALVTAVALLILEALPALYPRTCREEPFPTIIDVHNYERETGLVGVDPEGSYFPRTVQQRPAGSPLESDYREGLPPARFDLSQLPEGATAAVTLEPLAAAALVQSATPFTARYLSFAFPGWVATVDGREVPITPSDPEGLITFPVPAGAHEVHVRWASTPLRTTLVLLGLLALAGIIVTAVILASQPAPTPAADSMSNNRELPWLPLILLAVGLLAFKLLLVDAGLTPLRRPALPNAANPAALTADGLRFAGHTLSREQAPAGSLVDVDLAWITETPTLSRYQSNVWLAGPDGLLWSDKETFRPRLYEDAPPTSERDAGEWVWDSRELAVLSGTPPGEYDVVLTLFDLDTLQPLTLLGESGEVIGPTAVIDQITITMPAEPPEFKPQFAQEIDLSGTGLKLLGYNQDRATAVPGESLLLTLFWERLSGPLSDKVDLHLLDESGSMAYSWSLPPAGDGFDGTAWTEGERLRGQHLLRLPAGLPGGTYQVQLQGTNLGTLAVTAPERIMTQPAVEIPLDVSFGDAARLAGLTPQTTPDGLALDLVWQALDEMDTSYRVFVHVLNEDGDIIAQSDAEPAGWVRPTSGWAPPEYILDRHLLAVDAKTAVGPLRLRIGLYDPLTGERLATESGDALTIPLTP
jgi:hypothetical protein